MSVTSVQHAVAVTVSDGDTITLPSAATAGNMVVVYALHSYPGCPPTVTNSESSTVTERINTSAPGGAVHVATMVVGATGSYSVTAHMACGNFRLFVVEEVTSYDPTTPINTSSYDIESTNSTSTFTLGPITPASGAGLRAWYQKGITSYTPTSGWTAPLDVDGFSRYLLQGKTAPSTSPVSCVVGLSNASSDTVFGMLFSMNPAAVTNTITVTTQPASTVSGVHSNTVVVTSTDTTDNSTVVTATVVGSGTTLSGTTTATMVSGVATFANLIPTGVGTARHYHFVATGYTAIDSADFTVTAPATAPIPIPLLFGAN